MSSHNNVVSYGHLKNIIRRHKNRLFLVFDEIDDAISFAEICPGAEVFHPWEILPFEPYYNDKYKTAGRFAAIRRFLTGETAVLITSAQALFQKIGPREIYEKYMRPYAAGDVIDRERFIKGLVRLGYERGYEARYPGQFAVRGEIIDVFVPSEELPFRIVLWDTEIEEIRNYNPDTQLTVGNAGGFVPLPVKEAVYDESIDLDAIKEKVPVLELMEKEDYEGMSGDFPFLYGRYDTIMELIPADTVVIRAGNRDDKEIFMDKMHLIEKVEGDYSAILPFFFHDRHVTPEEKYFISSEGGGCALLEGPVSDKQLIQEISLRKAGGYGIAMYFDNVAQRDRFTESFPEISAASELKIEPFSGSYRDDIKKEMHVSEDEMLGRYLEKKNMEYASSYKRMDDIIGDIREGDLIVHVDYGIGAYGGVVNESIAGKVGDYVLITYRENAKIYVPVDHLDKIEKYIGDKKTARLNSLRDNGWKKTKAVVRNRIRDFAVELLSLQARRKAVGGYAFAEDGPWQKAFEESFIYKATPDQFQAVKEIKEDMESDSVMERLLCGDVGFGKTEVAVRAAFKAVQNGKQVALLCPTTVLAIQHLKTFRERLAEYPVTIEMLSRLVTGKKATGIKEGVKKGVVDIVIGTHKIILGNLAFKDLGLLIIDEEQRFGVMHKEKLKYDKQTVDTLVLSATPIPRTLYMSLVGIMDLSRLDTPPKNRHPIRTRAISFDERLLKEIIFREVRRKGQVFFIHNRVKDIDTIKQKLEDIVDGRLKVDYVHGQMSSREIEGRLMRFINKETDLLIATTIIENGVDIPNVNTVIINEADKFGLSQLYQIRGRVGRRETQAYAYLIVPPRMSSIAGERVDALLNFDYLGAGFEIAMRDLELRGAGNIIGKEQSGYMNMIGYDLYMRLLGEAVAELKGEEAVSAIKVTMDLDIPAFIPDDYIKSGSGKIEFYKKIYGAADEDAIQRVRKDMADRYGRLPEETENLLEIASMRLKASHAGIVSVEYKGGYIETVFDASTDMKDIMRLVEKYGKDLSFDVTGGIKALLRADEGNVAVQVNGLIDLLLHGGNDEQ